VAELEVSLPVVAAAPAYVGPLTWDDRHWRCCRTCLVEWTGDATCFLDRAHRGDQGRLRSWCRHGRRRVRHVGADICGRCETHDPSDFTPEFYDALSLTADRVLAESR
jgi:hypothetical protein